MAGVCNSGWIFKFHQTLVITGNPGEKQTLRMPLLNHKPVLQMLSSKSWNSVAFYFLSENDKKRINRIRK